MMLTVNGEERQVDNGATVAALLNTLDLSQQATVVERNGKILKRPEYGKTVLCDGDTLELVRLVGGG
jgi:thiamine biosynthesis protein ThiS